MKSLDELEVITDKDTRLLGLNSFSSVVFREDTQVLEFTYRGGKKYDVPLRYFRTWFPAPHEQGHAVSGRGDDVAAAGLVGTGGACAQVVLRSGAAFYVGWDLVLMACEPKYIHYGGLTKESQQNTKRWRGAEGPRRLRST